MKIVRHFEKYEKNILKRVTALLCAAALLFVAVPQGAFSAFAEEAEGVVVSVTTDGTTAPDSPLELKKDGSPVSLQVKLEKVNQDDTDSTYTCNWSAASANGLVTPSISGAADDATLSIAIVSGAYGYDTITISADSIKKDADGDGEDSEPEDVDGTATATVAVKVIYTPDLQFSIYTADDQEIADLSEVPYGTALKAVVTDNGGASPAVTYSYSYSWASDDGSSSSTEEAFTPAKTGSYSLTITPAVITENTNGVIETPAVGTLSFTVVQAAPTVNVEVPEDITYGDDDTVLAGKIISFTSSVPGEFEVTKTDGSTVPVTLAETTGTDGAKTYTGSLAGNGVLNTDEAEEKVLTYTFTPTDAGNYKTLSGQTVSYTVGKRPITVNLIGGLAGKNYDGTCAYNDSGFTLAENNTITGESDPNVVTYGEYIENGGSTALATGDQGTPWQLQNFTAGALSYAAPGSVSEDETVKIVVLENQAEIAFSDGAGAYTASENYAVEVTCTDEVTIEKNDFTAEEVYVLPAAGYVDESGVAWYQGEKIEVEPAPTYNTPGDETSGTSGYAYILSTDAGSWDGTEGDSVEVVPGMTEDGDNYHSAVIYAKRIVDGLIGQLIISDIAVDNTGPSFDVIKVEIDDGTEKDPAANLHFGKKQIAYTIKATDADSGVKSDSLYYAVTDTEDRPADDSDEWKQVTEDITSVENGYSFQVTAKQYGYVWVRGTDNVSNPDTQSSYIRTLVVEETTPTVTISQDNADIPAGGTEYAKSQTVNLAADDQDQSNADAKYSGISKIKYTLTKVGESTEAFGSSIEKDAPASLSALSSVQTVSQEVTFSVDDSGNPLDGDYTLAVTAVDNCGNESTPVTAVLKFDNTVPAVAASMNGTENGAGDFYYNSSNCAVTVTLKDTHTNISAATLELADENGTTVSVEVTKNGDGEASTDITGTDAANITVTGANSGEMTFTFTPAAVGALEEGEVTLTVSGVTDDAGNEATDLTVEKGMTKVENQPQATFKLDFTPPVITAISSLDTEGLSPNGYGDDYYYKNDIKIQFTVDDSSCDSLDFSYKKDGGELQTITLDKQNGLFSFTFSEGGRYTEIKLSGKDDAGNPLTASEDQSDWEAWSMTNEPTVVDGNGVVTLSTNKVIDKDAPVAEIVHTTSDRSPYDEENGTVKAFFFNNPPLTVAITVTDNYGLDTEKITAQDQSGKGLTLTEAENSNGQKYAFEQQLSGDGRYSFAVYGTDRAGNPVTVKETWPDGKTHVTEECGTAYQPSTKCVIVIDTESPKLTFSVTAPGATDQSLQTSYGNRFYLNTGFTSTLSITDENLDQGNIKISTGTNSAASNYMQDTVTPSSPAAVSVSESNGTCSVNYTGFSGTAEGLYILSVSGTDKAGNPIVCSSLGTALGSNPFESGSNGTYTSYIIAIDTSAPSLDIEIGDYYSAKLTRDGYSVSANMPYRKENSAILSYKGADASPILVEYRLYSSISDPGPSKTAGNYAINESGSYTIQGEQVFAIESLSVTDIAGNKVEAAKSVDNRVSNLIYLDVTAPDEDQLAPTVRFVAHESGQGRSQAGVELYNGTVTVDAIITDPGFSNLAGGKSSGLYAVYYEVFHNDAEDWTSMMSGRVRSAGTSSEVGTVYYASGKDYEKVENETLTGRDTLTFTFDAAQFNYNDISIRVWAEDNSGNQLGKRNVAVYRFGIDTSTPSIQVSYDNNDVQNDKYFKADRTATVVVQERNFDPDNTQISAAGGAVSGWTYARGVSANGDDDTWTCTVSYTTDGDYTFDVKTTDLVGHTAGEADYSGSAAPRDFTVDKTQPEIAVTFDNNTVQNGIYYKEPRMATIAITEHNFEASAAQVNMTASIAEGETSAPTVSAWSSGGDENTATAYFEQDGTYTMNVAFTDLAGNQAEPLSVSEFVIDQTAPTIEIGGVEDKHAYNGQVSPSITYHDINYDNTSAGISITGVKHEDGQNLPGTASDDAFGGSFICNNIESVKDNDDVYTVTGSVSDLAGNVSEATLVFSINRFGSNYVIIDKITKNLLDAYYTNNPQDVQVTEINVTELSNQEVTNSLNGELPVTLEKDRDYTIETSNPGWFQSDYNITESNFMNEGNYVITLSSTDEAQNTNSNRTIKEDNGQVKAQPVEFLVDMTPPLGDVTGITDGEIYNAPSRTVGIYYSDNTSVKAMSLYLNDILQREYTAEELADMGNQMSFEATASNEWQQLKLVLTDIAGNSSEVTSGRYLLTENLWVRFINSPLMIAGAVAVLLVIGFGIGLLIWRRKRDRT